MTFFHIDCVCTIYNLFIFLNIIVVPSPLLFGRCNLFALYNKLYASQVLQMNLKSSKYLYLCNFKWISVLYIYFFSFLMHLKSYEHSSVRGSTAFSSMHSGILHTLWLFLQTNPGTYLYDFIIFILNLYEFIFLLEFSKQILSLIFFWLS